MREIEYINQLRQYNKKAIALFSKNPQAQKKRELWVSKNFLLNLDIPFDPIKDLTKNMANFPDIFFLDARFEIKEVFDRDRRRSDEYKEYQKKLEATSQSSELIEYFSPINLTLSEIGDIIISGCEKIAAKRQISLHEKKRTDLLFYFNLQDCFLHGKILPDKASFSNFGWRSISVLDGNASMVLFAAPTAPTFIREKEGSISVNPNPKNLLQ